MTLAGCSYVMMQFWVDCPPVGWLSSCALCCCVVVCICGWDCQVVSEVCRSCAFLLHVLCVYKCSTNTRQANHQVSTFVAVGRSPRMLRRLRWLRRMFRLFFSKACGSQRRIGVAPFALFPAADQRWGRPQAPHNVAALFQGFQGTHARPTHARPICCFICADPFRPAARHTQTHPGTLPPPPPPSQLQYWIANTLLRLLLMTIIATPCVCECVCVYICVWVWWPSQLAPVYVLPPSRQALPTDDNQLPGQRG